MLTGTHRFPRQDQIVYGRPAAEVVRELAKAWGASRLLVTTTRSLADGLAAAGWPRPAPCPRWAWPTWSSAAPTATCWSG